jgi:hypothetical protein
MQVRYQMVEDLGNLLDLYAAQDRSGNDIARALDRFRQEAWRRKVEAGLPERAGTGRDGHPMVSVILDEFAPFAYPNFAQILQTARGSNITLLISLQLLRRDHAFNLSQITGSFAAPHKSLSLKIKAANLGSVCPCHVLSTTYSARMASTGFTDAA